MRLVTPLEMLKLEEKANAAGCTYDMMMEHAGKGLAEHLTSIAENAGAGRILFLCGNGNNAGDCFVAARLLSPKFEVTVCMVNGPVKTRTAHTQFYKMRNIRVLNDTEEILAAVRSAALIVDGVFGIGFRGELSPEIRTIFSAAAESGAPIIAVDIPSGASGLSGTVVEGTPRCTATVTFGAAKLGLFLAPLSSYCGAVYLVEIGIPQEAFDALRYPVTHISAEEVQRVMPARPDHSHKGMFGRLLGIAGSRNMPGAAILASQAALRCGVGTYCLGSSVENCRMLIQSTPEAMMLPLPTDADGILTENGAEAVLEYAKSCSAVMIGCGLGSSVSVRMLIEKLIAELTCPIVLDADGLNAIADQIDILHRAKATVILTPHPGEMSRLLHISTADIEKDRLSAAKRLATRFPKTVVVLKGAGTIVATAERAAVNTTGNSGMSKGGSGDVLAGMIGSFAAQGIAPEDAARISVYLHGLAGDCAAAEFTRRAMLPSDLIRQLPLVFGDYDS